MHTITNKDDAKEFNEKEILLFIQIVYQKRTRKNGGGEEKEFFEEKNKNNTSK